MSGDGVDSKLLEALKLLAERPEILSAALALARGDVVQNAAAKPTIAELWSAYELVAPTKLAAGTWRARCCYRETLGRLALTLDDGTRTTIADLAYDLVTPRVAEIYRSAREREDNGQGGTIAKGTVNRELGAVQSMLTWHVAVTKKIPDHNLKGWGRADESGDARQTYLTPEQAHRFISAGRPLFQDICTVAYRCAGMRPTEARMLMKSSVDFASKVINLGSRRTKMRQARPVPFPSDVEAILRRNCEASKGPFVFVRPTDPDRIKPVSASTFHNWLDMARERSGITGFDGEAIVVHTLRHCAVTDLLQAKVDPTAVMAAAGMSPKTLQRYSKFGPDQQANLRKHLEEQLSPPDRVGPRRAASVRPGRLARR